MSTESSVVVMDQMIDSANANSTPTTSLSLTPLAQSLPMAGVKKSGSDNRAVETSSVALQEEGVTGLLTLRATEAADALSTALDKHLNLTLPGRLQSLQTSMCCIRWMSPDEWLLSCPLTECFAIEQALRAAIPSDLPLAIVNVSGGYGVLRLSGADAVNVLKKSTAYDVHPDHFPPGKVVNTTFAKTQATIRALPEHAYELIVRRSYADYVWLWLQRAGAEYGLALLNGGSE